MKYPLYIDKVANGYILTPTPLHGEFTPREEEIFVFENLEALFTHLKDQEEAGEPDSTHAPLQENDTDATPTFNDGLEDIAAP